MPTYYNLTDGTDPAVGVDIDNVIYGEPPNQFGDYEVLNSPNLSGGSFVIPSNPDMGVPVEYTDSRGRRDFRMTNMLEGVQRGSSIVDNGDTAFRESDGSLYRQMLDAESTPIEDVVMGETFNGRLHDASIVKDTILPNPNAEIIINKDNQESSLRGLLEKNAVNDIFFSEMNVNGLNESIRYGVHLKTEKTISKQSENELYTVMRSIMLQYANFQISTDNIVDEIKRLNNKVILYCVDNISSNVLQHIGYIDDLSRLPEPMDRPVVTERNTYTYDISNLL
jgi:hypothetical protein